MRLGIYFSDEDIEYIDEMRKIKNCNSRSKIISLIINEHKNRQTNEIKNVPEYMAKIIAEELKDEFKNIKSIKSATNSVNKDTQIILQLLNGIYYREEYGIIPDVNKNPTKPYTDSVERVETKIAREQYIKNKSLD